MRQQSNSSRPRWRQLVEAIPVNVWIALMVVLLAVAAVLWLARAVTKGTEVGLTELGQTLLTPTQIKKIESIGEWEFLAVSDEEIADTVRRGFFGDSELTRIYYGTLRLGIDLRRAPQGWIRMDGDTLRASLPPISLLSDDFIDEARTRTFYESGSWTAADRKSLYDKAQRAMRQRVMSRENITAARQTALAQMDRLLHAMGFDHVSVAFADEERHR